MVAVGPLAGVAATTDVAVVPWPRNERGALAGLKTTSYGENVVALAWARERGAGEAIFANLAGDLCEGTGTNVFVASTAGWSRRRCGRLPRRRHPGPRHRGGRRSSRTTCPSAALADADEAFLTSTTREVQPIAPSTAAPSRRPRPAHRSHGRRLPPLRRTHPRPVGAAAHRPAAGRAGQPGAS